MKPEELLGQQIAYYRARAAEYDEWFLRLGRYDRGAGHRERWSRELNGISRALQKAAPLGETLEIACGTGLWTGILDACSHKLTALDAVPETIARNREKNAGAEIEFITADIFTWQPGKRYDTIFFGFWLSHVPPSHFVEFWKLVSLALKPGGRVMFVDSLKTQSSTALDHASLDDSGIVERQVNSGERFSIVKRFYEPEPLLEELGGLGWAGRIRPAGEFFLFGDLGRAPDQGG